MNYYLGLKKGDIVKLVPNYPDNSRFLNRPEFFGYFRIDLVNDAISDTKQEVNNQFDKVNVTNLRSDKKLFYVFAQRFIKVPGIKTIADEEK